MSSVDDLHLVAAVFPGWDEARAAEHELSALLEAGVDDLAVGPAGGDARAGGPALLAGRFRGDRMTEIAALVAEHAGTMLVDIPEEPASFVVDVPEREAS